MLTVLICAVVAFVAGLLRGGTAASLAATKVRWLWLVYAGVLLQVGGALVLEDDAALAVVLVSNGAIALFLVANYRMPGMALGALGLLLNVVVIGANGAMPVSQSVIERAGGDLSSEIGGLKHEPLTDDTTFPFLGDVIPVPYVREVLSIGDVLLALGIAYFVYVRTTAEPRKGRHSLVE